MQTRQFHSLLVQLARACNRQDVPAVVACFSPDAVLLDAISAQQHHTHAQISPYIAQLLGRGPVHMVWHHLLFDEAAQTGSGEFSITQADTYQHGMAMIQIVDSLILRWRAYAFRTPHTWQQMTGPAAF